MTELAETTEYFVSFALEHTVGPHAGNPAYAGNIDSKMYGFVTGEEDYRNGASTGREFFEKHIAEFWENFEPEFEWGHVDQHDYPYGIDPYNTNALYLNLDWCGEDSEGAIYRHLRPLVDLWLGVDVDGHRIASISIHKKVSNVESLYTMKAA